MAQYRYASVAILRLLDGALCEVGEGREVRQRLAVLHPPRPLAADRRSEAEFEQRVEASVGVLEHRTEDPIQLLGTHRVQWQPTGEVDVPAAVDRPGDCI